MPLDPCAIFIDPAPEFASVKMPLNTSALVVAKVKLPEPEFEIDVVDAKVFPPVELLFPAPDFVKLAVPLKTVPAICN